MTAESMMDVKSKCVFHHAKEVEQQQKFRQEKIISAPLDYLAGFPGKDFRGKLMSTFNQWYKIPEEKLAIIKNIVGLLHMASLLIDDIQDSSKLRRGFPVAHSIFGIAQTINSANYAYFWAQRELCKLSKAEAFHIFTEELLNLHRGQGMDLYWRDSLTCPTEEEYLEMVSNKTGGLFRLAIRLIQLESQSDLDCVPLIDLLGTIFQIRDDYQNLQSNQYAENKGLGEDITEGKFSYPIIHSIRSSPGNAQLMNILRQRPEDTTIKQYAIKIIESTGSFAYCREKLAAQANQARTLIEGLPVRAEDVGGLENILDLLELKG
ncbi:isoprenoid synthase domain-containing protein [Aspergillus aurantiobrunneus]